MMHRVVITGIGTVNPTGLSVGESWDNIVNGRSGIAPSPASNANDYLVRWRVKSRISSPTRYMEAREVRRRDRFQQFATAASQEALAQSGLKINEDNGHRVVGHRQLVHWRHHALSKTPSRRSSTSGPRRVNPFTIPMLMPNGAGGLIAIDTGARGPNFSVASACASANDSMGQAWLLVASGTVDAAITGGQRRHRVRSRAWRPLTAWAPCRTARRMCRSPSTWTATASSWAKAAGMLIMETLEHAQARGAEILAELAGYSATADAYHITAPAEDGVMGSRAMRQAMDLRRHQPRSVGLYQRARHRHPAERRRRNARREGGAGRARLPGAHIVHEVDDRPHDGRHRRGGSRVLRADHPHRRHAAHHQLPHARSRVRSGLCAQHRARSACGRRHQQCLRLWRAQCGDRHRSSPVSNG